jgi:hypothetical protein
MSPPTRKRGEDGSPNCFAPGLLAWLEHAVGWEIDRRTGAIYPLLGPHAAIDDMRSTGVWGHWRCSAGVFVTMGGPPAYPSPTSSNSRRQSYVPRSNTRVRCNSRMNRRLRSAITVGRNGSVRKPDSNVQLIAR